MNTDMLYRITRESENLLANIKHNSLWKLETTHKQIKKDLENLTVNIMNIRRLFEMKGVIENESYSQGYHQGYKDAQDNAHMGA